MSPLALNEFISIGCCLTVILGFLFLMIYVIASNISSRREREEEEKRRQSENIGEGTDPL